MDKDSRIHKTLLNAKVNLLFYFLTLLLTFFSRKIFLDCLGASFIGLTGTLTNILGYLNLAELGVGAAVAFNLYKPIQQKDTNKINDLLSLFGYYYRNIGLIVFGAAVIISAFIPLIFKDADFQFGVIYFAFYSFLISNLLGYFINYRQILLTADQRNYVVSAYFQTGNIIKTIVQLTVAYYWKNFYVWIAIELSFNILYCFILNFKIDKTYPWLETSAKRGRAVSKEYPNILQSTKQVFVHKIKDFILTQSDQIFIFAFVSLKMVAYYGNYILIISRSSSLLTTVLDSVVASVGNLVAENNRQKLFRVFWELMAVRFFIAGLICFCIYTLITPFISLWLGSEYILSHDVLVLLCINLFIMQSRGTVDNFNFAYGNFGDVWAAWAEGIINISITLIGGYFWGIKGILLGKTLSLIPIVVIWKPIYLFKAGFKEKISTYWKAAVRYYIIFSVIFAVARIIISLIPINPEASWGWWITYSTITTLMFIVLYAGTLTVFAPGGKNLIRRLPLEKIGVKF